MRKNHECTCWRGFLLPLLSPKNAIVMHFINIFDTDSEYFFYNFLLHQAWVSPCTLRFLHYRYVGRAAGS
jgi:hypothetical protein